MNLIFTIVAAFPIGFLVGRRGSALGAVTLYLAVGAFLFCFQTLWVLLGWMSGEKGLGGAEAFGPAPSRLPLEFADSELYGYGAVNLVITLVGVGLAMLGVGLARRRVPTGLPSRAVPRSELSR